MVTLVNLGVDQVVAGEFPAAMAYLQDALRVADAHGYQHLSAAAEMNLGFAYLMNGDAASARLCVPKTFATWVDASTGSRPRSAVSGTLLAILA